MKARTIKVGGNLVQDLEATRPASQTLAAYVRSLLESGVRRQKMAAAADRYTAFLAQTPEERSWLDEWGTAKLVRPPKRRRALPGD